MITALIVAAGRGSRLGGDTPKQYLPLAGNPVLTYSLKAFDRVVRIEQLILVVAANWIDHCREQVVALSDVTKPVTVVAGGKHRQDSVTNGLDAIGDDVEDSIVLIHDGARPLVSATLVENCIDGALKWGACAPGIVPVDTLKQITPDGYVQNTISRDTCRQIQTPQAFSLKLIRRAHENARKKHWQATDDAALVERLGIPVKVIPGEPTNLKITNRRDLILAEFYCKKRLNQRRRKPCSKPRVY